MTISPKPQFHDGRFHLVELERVRASECKVVVDDTVDDAALAAYERRYPCDAYFVQPCMDARYDHHLARAIELASHRPRWRLGLQLHKILNVP